MAKTLVDIKDDLLREAMKLTGIKKKVEIVNFALKKLVAQEEIEKILNFKGNVDWQGDLEKMRRNRK